METTNKLLQQLTVKERVYLRYSLSGYNANQIADLLHRSKRTVESHLRNIRMKFDCKNKSQLFHLALRHGLLSVHI
jgi:DNA-binding CsgD family transcriptional regulator